MLKQLSIRNYVLIQSLDFEFKPGFSVILGETGAGKSIFLTALLLLMGQRLNQNVVGKFGDDTLIEGLFSFDNTSNAYEKCLEAGFDPSEELIFSRKISRDGKSSYRINRQLVPIGLVKEILALEIDIHSQFNTHQLLDNQQHLAYLDLLVPDQTLIDQVHQAYQTLQHAQNEKKLLLEMDFSAEAYAKLQAEIQQYEKLNFSLHEYQKIVSILEQGETALDKIERLTAFQSRFQQVNYEKLYACFDADIDPTIDELIKSSYYQLDEVNQTILQLISATHEQPLDLEALNQRLFEYQKAMRQTKSPSIESLLELIQSMNQRLRDIEVGVIALDQVDSKIRQCHANFLDCAMRLSKVRKETALELSAMIEAQAAALNMKHCHFKVDFTQHEHSHGIDKVKFMVAMNKGQDFSELSKSASGGELSRLMLILKTIFNHFHPTGLLIFDEIDSGVSGDVAKKMGLKMVRIARQTPLLCVTHLPLVASYADNAYLVEKTSSDEAITTVKISELSQTQTLEVLAMMLAGHKDETALALAQKLVLESKSHESL